MNKYFHVYNFELSEFILIKITLNMNDNLIKRLFCMLFIVIHFFCINNTNLSDFICLYS